MKKTNLFEKYIHEDSIFKVKDISIGVGTRINGKILIHGKSKVKIGKFNAIGYGVKIISTTHNINYPNLQLSLQRKMKCRDLENEKLIDKSNSVIIRDNVWIGNNVCILPGVEIGSGSVLGAGTIVTKSVKPFSINVGNPSSLLGYRFSKNIIQELLKIKWWNWDEKKMMKNKKFFNTNLKNFKGSLFDIIK